MKKYKIGIIGCGHIAEKMAATINEMQETEQCKPMSLAVKFNCACREIFNVVPSGLHELFQTISKLSFLYTLDHFH